MSPTDALLGLLRVALALVAGYVIGSLPVAGWIGRRAGVAPVQGNAANLDAADVWAAAGPGAGLLALAADLAKGIVPVAVATVTFGWWTGWVAAAGAVAGACLPRPGRGPGAGGIATLAGACFALAPLAGLLALVPAGLVAAVARLAGRDARVPGIVAGFAAFLALALLDLADAARLSGLGLLVLLAAAAVAAGRRRRRRGSGAGAGSAGPR